MKKISREEQMVKNGGVVYAHCHICNAQVSALTKNGAKKKLMKNHTHNAYAYWDYGQLKYCPKYYK